MVKLWVIMTSKGRSVDEWEYINPLHIRVVRDNGYGESLIELDDCWYIVRGEPAEVARRIRDFWRSRDDD